MPKCCIGDMLVPLHVADLPSLVLASGTIFLWLACKGRETATAAAHYNPTLVPAQSRPNHGAILKMVLLHYPQSFILALLRGRPQASKPCLYVAKN
jgi:hypothetical protein